MWNTDIVVDVVVVRIEDEESRLSWTLLSCQTSVSLTARVPDSVARHRFRVTVSLGCSVERRQRGNDVAPDGFVVEHSKSTTVTTTLDDSLAEEIDRLTLASSAVKRKGASVYNVIDAFDRTLEMSSRNVVISSLHSTRFSNCNTPRKERTCPESGKIRSLTKGAVFEEFYILKNESSMEDRV